MGNYKPLYSSIWTDNHFENYSPEKKLLYIFLLTNQYVEKSGIYKVSVRQMAFNTGLINELINELINDGKILYDFKNGIIFIKSIFKYQKGVIKNENILTLTIKRNYELVKTEFWNLFFEIYSSDDLINKIKLPLINGSLMAHQLYINKNKNNDKNSNKNNDNKECKLELKNDNVNNNINNNINKKSSITICAEKSELDIFCEDVVNGFQSILEDKMQRKITTNNWQKDIKLLISKDLQPRGEEQAKQDVIKCIQAIADNWKANYFPEVQSASAFREKFTKIENFLTRKKPRTKQEQLDLERKEQHDRFLQFYKN